MTLCGWNLKSKIIKSKINKVEAIIKLENAVIRQQKNTILKDVSLEIKEGEFVYLIVAQNIICRTPPYLR